MAKVVFNWRGKPKKDESIRGYLLRLTGTNGYKSVSDRLNQLGLSASLVKLHPRTDQAEKIFYTLDPLLNLEKFHLKVHFQSHWSSKVLSSYSRIISNICTEHCRVCVECLKEDPYHKSIWDIAPIVGCEKHKSYLTDVCPHCEQPISWSRYKVDKCGYCKLPFSTGKTRELEPNYDYYKILKNITDNKSNYLEDLINAISRIYRPQDNFMSKPAIHKMSIDEIIPLLNKATGLLHSEDYRRTYIEWLIESRSSLKILSEQAAIFPMERFLQETSIDLDNSIPNVKYEANEVITTIPIRNFKNSVKTARKYGVQDSRLRKLRKNVNSLDLTSQIRLQDLSDVLGIESETLGQLVSLDIIEPLNDVKTNQHMIFDLNAISRVFTKIIDQNTALHNPISLELVKKSHLPKYFGMKFSDIVKSIVRKEIKFSKKNKTSRIMDGHIELSELSDFMMNAITNRDRPLTTYQFSKILNTTTENIEALKKAEIISEIHLRPPYRPGDAEVDLNSFKNFMENYISINRACYFLGLKLKRTIKAISDLDILSIGNEENPLYIASFKNGDGELVLDRLSELVSKQSSVRECQSVEGKESTFLHHLFKIRQKATVKGG